jgi:hypothetical protein
MTEDLYLHLIIRPKCFSLLSSVLLLSFTSDFRSSRSCFLSMFHKRDRSLFVSGSMVDTWFLMGSPMPILGIVACYVSFVLKIGPKLMASRKPFNLQTLLVAYNFSMILLSLYIAISVSRKISLVGKEKRKIKGAPQECLKCPNEFSFHTKDNSLFRICVYNGSRRRVL